MNGFNAETLTAKELLEYILTALDCKGSVLSKFTHYDGSVISKDFFNKKKNAKKIFTSITKRNIAEIIYCALGMDDCIKANIGKIDESFFKSYSNVKKNSPTNSMRSGYERTGMKTIKYTDQWIYTLNLLKLIKLLCGTDYKYGGFIDLLIADQKIAAKDKLYDLQTRLDEIKKIFPKGYKPCVRKSVSEQEDHRSIEVIRQYFYDKKYDKIEKIDVNEELEAFRQWVIHSDHKTVLDFFKDKDISEIYNEIYERIEKNYTEASNKYSKQISHIIGSRTSRKLFKAIVANDICALNDMRVKKKLREIHKSAIEGNAKAIRKVIINQSAEIINKINQDRINTSDYYIRLFLYTFYVHYMKSIDDKSKFTKEAASLFKAIMRTYPFYESIYMKTDEMMEECTVVDKILGYSHYTNDWMKLKKSKACYVKEAPYTNQNLQHSHPKYILINGSIKEKPFDADEAVKNSVNGICEIIIDGKRDKSLNEIFGSISDFIFIHYPFILLGTQFDYIESFINGILSILINNNILSISFNKDNITTTITNQIIGKLQEINREIENMTLTAWSQK